MQTYCFWTASKWPAAIFLIWACFSGPVAFAQPEKRAWKHIRKLCSPAFAGRGYARKGDQKAARYLEKQFIRLGVKPLQNSYRQPLTFAQNLFFTEPDLFLNQRRIRCGTDWIPSPDVPEIRGMYALVRPGGKADSLLSSGFKPSGRQAWVLGPKEKIPSRAGAESILWVRESDKLTHSLAEEGTVPAEVMLKSGSIGPGDSSLTVTISPIVQNIHSDNVLGWVPGTRFPDQYLVVCAHYDHLGSLGKRVIFPGANDNASGVALLLELADSISRNPLPYSTLFIAFTGEEAGLKGSFHFVENPPVPLEKIRFVLNLDLFGFGEKGATVVNATLHPAEFERLQALNREVGKLPELKSRGKAANSDHYPFSEKGVPAFFVYAMGGPGHYHDVSDTPETLSLAGFSAFKRLFYRFLSQF